MTLGHIVTLSAAKGFWVLHENADSCGQPLAVMDGGCRDLFGARVALE